MIMNIREKLTEKYYKLWRFLVFVTKNFIADDCTYRASALAFTSLLAIVPLMSVGFAILSSLPVFHDLTSSAQDFIFENFIPASGKVVQGYLHFFTQQISKLSITSIIFLFAAAVLVMFTIERSMNVIWRVASARNGISAFLLYWAILSLAPLMLGISLLVSSYIFSLPFIKNHPTSSLLSMIPFFCSLIGFTFIYLVVPNCKVKLKDGLLGGIVAAILFESAKHGFAFYLTRFDTYQLLYGAFATIPIFFIWIYWTWVITLLGAEISYALSVDYKRRDGKPIDGFTHALIWLRRLWIAQQQGCGVSTNQLVTVTHRPYSIDVKDMMAILTAANLIRQEKNQKFILSRDLNSMTIYDLMNILPFKLPASETFNDESSKIIKSWQKYFADIDFTVKETLVTPVCKLFKPTTSNPSN